MHLFRIRKFNGFALSTFLCAAFICASGYGQNQPASSPEDQALQQQLQENFGTIMQNMMAKGIDPRQFFQKLQEGADPAEIQQQLVDQGIIDQKTLTQMQSTMQKLTNNTIRQQLEASDDEWAVLQPLIQKVMAASSAAGQQGMPMARFMTGQSPAAKKLSKAKQALAAAIKDANTTPGQFATALQAVRDARRDAGKELAAAQHELVSVLTVRQEGVLASMGIIE